MIRQTAAVHSSGLHLLAAPADAVEAMEIDDVLMARIITMARQTYDLVIVDTFPMFDRVVLAALDLSDRVYVVLENVVPTLLGGVKLLNVLERIGYPAKRQAIILNRQQRVAGSLSVNDVAERMQRDIDHVLPFDKRVVAAANCGVPIAMAMLRFSGFSRALEKLADDVAGSLAIAHHAWSWANNGCQKQSRPTAIACPVRYQCSQCLGGAIMSRDAEEFRQKIFGSRSADTIQSAFARDRVRSEVKRPTSQSFSAPAPSKPMGGSVSYASVKAVMHQQLLEDLDRRERITANEEELTDLVTVFVNDALATQDWPLNDARAQAAGG